MRHFGFWPISLAILCAIPTTAQPPLVTSLGDGVTVSGPRSLLEVEDTDLLLVAGASFHAVNGVTSPGILAWDGQSYSGFACGFNWDCVSPLGNGGLGNGGVYGLVQWNGEYYAGGDIYSASGIPINGVARWDGATWLPLGEGVDGMVYRLRAYPDGIYAVGSFTHAGGIEANGLARWDGTQWHSVFDLPVLDLAGTNLLNDAIWYQDKLYIGGNFGGGTGTGLNDIACWDGTQWSPIGNGFVGPFGSVTRFEIHDDLLYVAGGFADYPPYGNTSNPGSGIVTWDGKNWGQLGSATRGSANPTVLSMTWINDDLYITGRFGMIGNVPTGRLAKWDGERWCSLVPPDYFYPDMSCVGQYRDTLIVGGSFFIAGQDSVNRIVKWIGGAYTDTCGLVTGIHWSGNSMSEPQVFPNPASDLLTVILPYDHTDRTITLRDMLGKRILEQAITDERASIDVRRFARGCYLLRVGSRTKRVVLR